jgi:putative acetyltransferase
MWKKNAISRRSIMENKYIRKATEKDVSRVAEILIFNYRLNFYPIFKSDDYYFNELQVIDEAKRFYTDKQRFNNTYVYDDGAVKGFITVMNGEVDRLFVEPILQGNGIGAQLLEYAIDNCGAESLWALEKNVRAIEFYSRHGFRHSGEKKLEEDTDEYLLRLVK